MIFSSSRYANQADKQSDGSFFIWRVPMKAEFAFTEAELAEKNGI
jgi:hypothetical protein